MIISIVGAGEINGDYAVRIRHIRNMDSNKKAQNHGGSTVMVWDIFDSAITIAYCNNKDQFSRKKGVLTCVQKLLNKMSRKGHINPNMFYCINDYKFKDGKVIVDVVTDEYPSNYAWTKKGYAL